MTDLRGLIGRSVVYNNDLEIPCSLVQKAAKSLRNGPLGVVGRNDHRSSEAFFHLISMPFPNRMIPVAPFAKTLCSFLGGYDSSRNAPWGLYRSLVSLLYIKTIIPFIKNGGSVDARPRRLKAFKIQGPEAIMDKISDLILFG